MKLKRILIFVLIIVILFAMWKCFEVFKNKDLVENQEENAIDLYTFELFQPENKSYLSNMTYMNNIYFKKINNYEEYIEIKKIWNGISDMSQDDFKDKFMVITVIENMSMVNLSLGEVYTDDDNLYIGLKRMENPTKDGISIIIDRKMERNDIQVYKMLEN